MAELPPPEPPVTAAAATTTAAPPPPPPPPPPTTTNNLAPSLAPKRQRRPSVRLGEIGDHPRRHKSPWRFHRHPTLASKSSKTRPLTNLVNNGGGNLNNYSETLESEDNLEFGHQKPKLRRSVKRVRTNWPVLRAGNGVDNSEDNRDFEAEGSESPLKEASQVNSIDNVGLDSSWHGQRRTVRATVSESREDGLPESNKCGTSDGVREWLIGLGLGRYAAVFEIHEVDDEVLPMLKLEDLKDMGINAVGSRRKMYTSILKLRKGFS
ncbi:hypothetical protein RJ639_003829 [Escallonia herrerae]|uniref:SAM domain-containing protein n=1 Tax=Escallonia herrerae TaxID=1293975 RepID=A0AA88W1J1_9ASTE|nr:hypothetical protein RJ639_003829 [Escallonia herrerae]